MLAILDAAALGLPPRQLEDGLVPALEYLAARCPLPVALDASTARFAAGVESALYFAAAEAVTNSVKHSTALAITISLRATIDLVSLVVTDDGNGQVDLRSGTGLTRIADRVAALGGRFDVDSQPAAGTAMTVTIPLRGRSSGSVVGPS